MDFVPDVFKNPANWDSEPNPESNKDAFMDMAKEIFELNQLCSRVFKTRDGKKLLDWMRKVLDAPTWNTGVSLFEAIPSGFAREGQNAFVRDILNRMKIAERCKSPEDLVNYMKGNLP